MECLDMAALTYEVTVHQGCQALSSDLVPGALVPGAWCRPHTPNKPGIVGEGVVGRISRTSRLTVGEQWRDRPPRAVNTRMRRQSEYSRDLMKAKESTPENQSTLSFIGFYLYL
ncbi:hypothetical protein PoB_004310600 [Plakobranchus ocellatus]|uniref:Alcohol dehydrogenase N-terminal domain-containing protein n=1 Tax=Plakobranchus ocellatus TaxID=259542 RepID=A0AAV4AZL7_9GAST|nr:hypothetical protein PoB_004310600 [Plakobranchus ocellatus]